jgi:ferredoxin
MSQNNSSSVDIFGMLSENTEKPAEKPNAKTIREELLADSKCKDLFPEGSITINKYTCVGIQCKLCIKACPTNALYWTNSGIQVTEDLCVHCEACVLCCMVDECIKVTRKREDGKTETFSKPKDVTALNNQINSEKRFKRVKDVFPTEEAYFERYAHIKGISEEPKEQEKENLCKPTQDRNKKKKH